MKTYAAYLDIATHPALTQAERDAWLCPEQSSYNSFHIERLSSELFLWRESTSTLFYVGTIEELFPRLLTIRQRKIDENHQAYAAKALSAASVKLSLLSQSEIDDLLGDL